MVPELINLDSHFYSTYTDLYERGSHRRISLRSEGRERTNPIKPKTSNDGHHPAEQPNETTCKPTTAAEPINKPEDDDLLIPSDGSALVSSKSTKRRHSRRKKKDVRNTTAQLYVLGAAGNEEVYRRLLD